MTDELLRHPLHSGHLTVGALKRNKDKPVLFLGDTTLTGGQLADRISQYIQAFEAVGAGSDAGVAVDLNAEAAKYSPQPLVAADLAPDHIGGLTYTGGTTGKPKGVIGTTQSITTMTTVQLAEWEWPEHPKFLMCTPLSHAGAAFFTPTIVKGGELVVLTKFDPAEVLRVIEEQKITATMLVPSMIYALMDHPDSHTRD